MEMLNEIDERLHILSQKISFADINPINTAVEKDKFFQSETYNPIFKYRKPHTQVLELRKELAQITPDDSIVGSILAGIRDKYILDLDLVDNIGRGGFLDVSIRIHGQPNKELSQKASELIFLKIKPEPITFNTKQITKKLERAFVKYGFHWKVEEKEMIASAAVRLKEKKLLIRKNSKFSKAFLKRIIVHEIGTHVVRAENGEHQPFKFFRRGLPGYLMTEEGLAVYNEEINKCLNNYILKVYAGRVLAIEMAMKDSFRVTYSMLRQFFTRGTAWRLTVRAKRGLIDTSQPGAFTKDIAYLKGYLAIKKFVAGGGDARKLYYGKVGLQHIELLKNIDGLVNPKMLPMFRYFNFLEEHFKGMLGNLGYADIRDIKFSELELN